MPEKQLNLSNLSPAQPREDRKRVGRGLGSGKGRYSGRGIKGQKSRAGSHKLRAGFEGGQMPLRRRIPKRGFHNPARSEFAVVNVEGLNVFPAGTTVTRELLIASGLIREARAEIKVLGDGELKSSLTVQAHKFSKAAQEKITKAGGKFEVLQ